MSRRSHIALTLALLLSIPVAAHAGQFTAASAHGIFAQGMGIVSAWTNTSTRTGACREYPGTSMAAAFASGVAALYLETHPTALPAAVEQALIANAAAGVLYPSDLGAGSPNRMLSTFYP